MAKNLEAAGFERIQAEAQVQMVLDALEGELATKADFTLLKNDFAVSRSDFKSDSAILRSDLTSLKSEFKSDLVALRTEFKSDLAALKTELKSDLSALRTEFKSDLAILKEQIENRFIQVDNRFTHIEGQMREMELRLITRLGLVSATTTSIAVAFLAWLLKV